ncbi:prophage LambdaSa04%2C P27 family terminase small subunit [Streptococcus suis]|nr:prophage LambdaSa04%2C P27 family terminase small subunit [Streptococcus suis]
MGKILEQMGILTEMDMTTFAGYCQAYARWKEAEEFLTKHGSIIKTPNGYLQQVPQVSISQTNLKIMLKFCEQFGLTPSARNRLATMDAEVGTGNEMEDLLGGILLVIIMNQVHSCFQPHTMIRQRPIGQ